MPDTRASAKPLHVAIAGGGIGGLTAALSLAQAGHRVTVFEAVRELKPLGVGINLLPHAVGVLSGLGLQAALEDSAIQTEALVFANKFGQTIYRDPRGIAGGYAHPQLSTHRGSLHMILFSAVEQQLGKQALQTGARVMGCVDRGEGVRLQLASAQGARSTFDADVLIAADGIHSAIRAQFYPDEGPPKWNGMMMWRGVTEGPPFMGGRTMVQAGNKFTKFVVYPISRAHQARGASLINWICDICVADGIGGTLTAPSREDWSKPGKLEDLLPTFGNWKFDWLDVPGIIRNAQSIFEWPMVDRDPLPQWTFGRTTLLGDAAHPMYPIGSNGATQAILDAQALTQCLAQHAHPVQALAAYEAQRRPMTAEIVRMNRQEGLDVILDMVDERAPQGFKQLADVIDPAQIDAVVQRYKAAAGHRKVP
jgi:2-polyprenyl-6-methoxyphenol hydroxylase-like FAD-dependent oxidoreductase